MILKKQAGYTLLEIILAIAIIGILSVAVNDMIMSSHSQTKSSVAAEQVKRFSAAMQQYVNTYHNQIVSSASSSKPVLIQSSMLSNTGFLPVDFNSKNSYGQYICGLIIKNDQDRLYALTVTEDGQTINDTDLGLIASLIGGDGGAVYARDTSTIHGTGGAWSIPTSVFNGSTSSKCSGTAGSVSLTSGHIVQALWFNEGNTNTGLLARDHIEGAPELNRMNTDLDMNGNSINNVANLNASGDIFAETIHANGRISTNEYLQIDGIALENTACSPDGLIGRDNDGNILSCQSGIWKKIAGTPAGMIGYFATASCPSGWLLADGSNGTIDMRGVFPRGLDNGRGLDPGRTLASYQGDAMRNFTGYIGLKNAVIDGRLFSTGNYGGQNLRTGSFEGNVINFNPGNVVPVANENRPVNIALLACQKTE